MDTSFLERGENLVTLDIDKTGKELNISSTGDEMRLLECPGCGKHFIRHQRKEIVYAKCTCGVKIELKRRWYD